MQRAQYRARTEEAIRAGGRYLLNKIGDRLSGMVDRQVQEFGVALGTLAADIADGEAAIDAAHEWAKTVYAEIRAKRLSLYEAQEARPELRPVCGPPPPERAL